MMHWMRKIRNSCAHNEGIYGMIREGRVLQSFKEFLPDRNQYIMDLLIYMRYFLPDGEYNIFIDKIIDLLDTLKSKLTNEAFNRVRVDMGIKNIDDLNILKPKKKLIIMSSN